MHVITADIYVVDKNSKMLKAYTFFSIVEG
jgi:hypothetical protein